MDEKFHIRVFLIVVLIFCLWNLFRGLRTGRTWVRGFPKIEKRDSPWNYWVAILLWVFVTSGALGGLIIEFFGNGIRVHQ